MYLKELSFNYPKNLKGILLLSKYSQIYPLTIQIISKISSYYPNNLKDILYLSRESQSDPLTIPKISKTSTDSKKILKISSNDQSLPMISFNNLLLLYSFVNFLNIHDDNIQNMIV